MIVYPSNFFHESGMVDFRMGIGTWLLGIDFGHLPTYEPVLESDKTSPISEKWFVRGNTGLMTVVPAWKLLDLLPWPKERSAEENV